MKTLIISGTYTESQIMEKVTYDVCLFGQSKEHPTMCVITYKVIECRGFTELIDICKNIYANYFSTDLFNIITIEHISYSC